MFPSLAAVFESCRVSSVEAELLTEAGRPIVLLRRVGGAIATAVAPGNPWLGALLPYAPLHHLLLHELGFPVVATSGNLSDEPIVFDEREALVRLAGFADLFLVNDRPIVRPIDDSVARVVCGRELMLRRARGYAPTAIAIDGAASGIVALGGHLKTTIAMTTPGRIVLSQHIGDLDSAGARASHAGAMADMLGLHAVQARLVVRDLHPDYASSQVTEAMAIPAVAVQHHVAHVAACVAEHGVALPVLGVAWDGAGYGTDGTLWGGEFLRLADGGWRRVAHLRPFCLPGGEVAAREPRRAALGLLYEAFGEDAFAMTELAPLADFAPAERAVLRTMLARGINAPRTSSVGRLFDAFAALSGLRQRASYEGQAAAELEGAAEGHASGQGYPFALCEPLDAADMVLDWQPALQAALADLRAGAVPGAVSAALHAGLAAAIVLVAARIGERRVILTGGCFQNARLTEAAVAALRAQGFDPIWHRRVPPNDGGLALGQAAWAAWAEQRGERPCA
jgi:hydrogenase maturation protein HypF